MTRYVAGLAAWGKTVGGETARTCAGTTVADDRFGVFGDERQPMKPKALPILLGLAGVAALAWWQQARLQPSTDAETAARLG